jgi:UPF0716 protein FxsA|tara:strand:- start:556 stop:981 length:426 start_codon:yes stop_codon:yes gene_type:complete
MRAILLFGLILLPFIEIWGYFKFGSLYGWWFLIYLIVMAVLGWRLIQEEKSLVLSRFMSIMAHGGNPLALILGAAKNLMAGGLFLFPGIFTDIIAVILLLIPISGNDENLNKTDNNSFNKKKDTNKSDVIEGEYRREDDPK